MKTWNKKLFHLHTIISHRNHSGNQSDVAFGVPMCASQVLELDAFIVAWIFSNPCIVKLSSRSHACTSIKWAFLAWMMVVLI